MTTKPDKVILTNARSEQLGTVARATVYLVAIFLFCANYAINGYFGPPDIDLISKGHALDWKRQGMRDDAMNGWGLFDDDLLSRARAKLSQLHASGKPFNLSLLEFNGFMVDGGRLGLGYSAFNNHGAQPRAQRPAEMRSSVLNRSPAYRAL